MHFMRQIVYICSMKKILQQIRSYEPALRLVLSLLLLTFIPLPAGAIEMPQGVHGSHAPVETLRSPVPFDIAVTARQIPRAHEVLFTAFGPALTIPPADRPTMRQVERLQPYRLTGVRPLSLHLIDLQKTSADL